MASAAGFVTSRRGRIQAKCSTKIVRRAIEKLKQFWVALAWPSYEIEGNQPRTARLKLAEMLSSLKGTVRICDPYYGVRTLDTLDLIPRSCEILFLTIRSNESERQLKGAFQDFKRERPRVEFRLAANTATLHDRYLVTAEALLILGHELKNIRGQYGFSFSTKYFPGPNGNKLLSFDKWEEGAPM